MILKMIVMINEYNEYDDDFEDDYDGDNNY